MFISPRRIFTATAALVEQILSLSLSLSLCLPCSRSRRRLSSPRPPRFGLKGIVRRQHAAAFVMGPKTTTAGACVCTPPGGPQRPRSGPIKHSATVADISGFGSKTAVRARRPIFPSLIFVLYQRFRARTRSYSPLPTLPSLYIYIYIYFGK